MPDHHAILGGERRIGEPFAGLHLRLCLVAHRDAHVAVFCGVSVSGEMLEGGDDLLLLQPLRHGLCHTCGDVGVR